MIDGRTVDESAAKPMERALLHLLAARAGEQVHREALIEALWPEADPDAGLHRLQVAISSLRRLLAVDSRRPGRSCWPGRAIPTVWPSRRTPTCDVWQFEAHLRRAGRGPQYRRPDAARRRRWRRPSPPTAARCCPATVPPTGWSIGGPRCSRRPPTPPPAWPTFA